MTSIIFLVIPRASQRKSKEDTEIKIYESEVEESENGYRPITKNREMVKFHFPKMGLKKKTKKHRVSEGKRFIDYESSTTFACPQRVLSWLSEAVAA